MKLERAGEIRSFAPRAEVVPLSSRFISLRICTESLGGGIRYLLVRLTLLGVIIQSGCIAHFDKPIPSPCGDGRLSGEEVCDGSDLAGASCVSLGYPGGDLQCSPTCTFDVTECAVCGDGLCSTTKGEGIDNCTDDCGLAQLSVGFRYACACRGDGTVWCWGENENGQLGAGSMVPSHNTPVQVYGITTALQVDVAGRHSCALVDEDPVRGSAVWCWGRNDKGELGSQIHTNHYTPTKVPDLGERALQIDVGWFFSCVLLSGGTVKCWGGNELQRLGNCTVLDEISPDPVLVEGLTNASHVSADGGSTCALLTSNELSCWGHNTDGELGNGTRDATCVPSVVSALPLVVSAVMGDQYACAIESTGDAWCWGDNDWGQLGDTTDEDRQSPVRVANVPALQGVGLGWSHTCATTQTGSGLCWGRNDEGQLGNGMANLDFQPPVQVLGLEQGVLDIQAGGSHSCVLLQSGRILCWGNNDHGQLGNGSNQPSPIPVEVIFP